MEGAPGRGNSKGNGPGEEPHCTLRHRKEATVLASYCGLCGKKQARKSGIPAQLGKASGLDLTCSWKPLQSCKQGSDLV